MRIQALQPPLQSPLPRKLPGATISQPSSLPGQTRDSMDPLSRPTRDSHKPLPEPLEPKPPGPGPDPVEPSYLPLIDRLKRRSGLVNMLDPMAMTLSMVTQPAATYQSLSHIAGALAGGQTQSATAEIEKLVSQAVNPRAPYSYAYRGGQILGAVMDGSIGGLEIAEGLNKRDPFLVAMGAADVLGGTSSAVVAAGYPTVSLAMTLVASGAKTALVASRPQSFTRIQIMKTCFEAGFAVSTSMLRAGVGVVPALGTQAVLGVTELLYMNVPSFQKKADVVLDWVAEKWPRSQSK